MMKRLGFATVLFFLVTAVSPAMAQKEVVVLTSLDVIQAMGEVLTRGTSMTVKDVIPDGYSMQGQKAYLKKHRTAFFEIAAKADAVLSVGSAWTADPLYQWARRGNIHVVNIDVTQSLDGYGAGVPMVEVEGEFSPYVWRSPANLTRMAAIAADDLCRLVPSDADVVRGNLKVLQTELFKLRSRYEGLFMELDFVELAALTSGYTCLADEYGLNVAFHMLKPEEQWTDGDARQLAVQIKKAGVRAVICSWEPGVRGLEALRDGGATPVVLKRFVRGEEEDALTALVEWFDGNLSRLVAALKD
ncbi:MULTISPECIES: zinc ABC transporter substrate-binding protein [unclassified Pseudodesulfovibrio]|uniref:metal ABC transporter solute-binding protein, Zn/Mn family n=1 Tax=unclassified Pseudodesulfovibrio TaxID=2661612 RepID=UPI000FEBA2C0|nr:MULTISPECIES: zinc ABC transporter substrate-binding protein [unclassified Pseudodesulfovibrio]MCJ2163358.1 zinc ABC transporter substrate-binding protein [Pseudodesulfovibrio sp. S3-i]RWU06597.1 hypothetical protein DWB63_02215 [Pseudodesulfovibrio sp. S3]